MSPVLLAEARQSLDALRSDAVRQAGLEGVKRVVGRRLAVFPPMSMSDGAWAAWWQDYIDVLGDLPEQALEAGMKAWLRSPDSDFLPKPGKLRHLAQQAGTTAITAYDRAKAAIGTLEPPEDKPPAEKEAVRRMMEEFRHKTARPPAPEPIPPAHGETDEAGVTPALRAILETRAP